MPALERASAKRRPHSACSRRGWSGLLLCGVAVVISSSPSCSTFLHRVRSRLSQREGAGEIAAQTIFELLSGAPLELLCVSLPDADEPAKELGEFALLVNVLYSLVPAASVIIFAVRLLLIVMRGWPSEYSRAGDADMMAWGELARRQMRQLVSTLKSLTFLVVCVAFGVWQARCVDSPRPRKPQLCWLSGMPCIEALCAFGLLTLALIELMNCLAVKHLTYRRKESGDRLHYTEAQMERLGYVNMSANQFFTRLLFALGVFGPVPMARILLGDATFAQACVGCAEGVALGAAFHVCFVKLCSRGGRRMQLMQQRVLIPILQWKCIVPGGWHRSLRNGEFKPTPWARGYTAQEDAFAEELEELYTVHRSRMRQEARDYDEKLKELWERMPDQLVKTRGQKLSKLAPRKGEADGPRRHPLLLPGFEFLFIRTDAFFHLFAQKEQELEMVELANETLTERVREANEDLMNQQIALQEQHSALLFQRQESQRVREQMVRQQSDNEQEFNRLRQQMTDEQQAVQREHMAALEAARREHEVARREHEDMMRQHEVAKREHQAALEAIKQESERAQEVAKREHQADMARRQEVAKREHQAALEAIKKESERAKELAKREQEAAKRESERAQQVAQREHQAALEAIKLESERAKAKHNDDLERSLRANAQRLSKAMQQAEEEFERAKQQAEKRARQQEEDFERARRQAEKDLEEQKQKQGKFVQDIITFAQALSKMFDAVKDGDRKALEVEVKNVRELKNGLQEESIQKLAEPLLEQASQCRVEWTRRIQDLGDAIYKAGAYRGNDPDKLSQCARQLFGTVTAAIDKGLNISKHDKALCVDAERWLSSRWLTCITKNHLDPETGEDVVYLQNRIIHKAVWATKETLGTFDFTDLEACLEHVDCTQKTFIASAKAQVEHNPPRSLERALSQLSTLIYFLNYLEREDLQKTKQVFKAYLTQNQTGAQMGKEVQNWVRVVSERYGDDSTLLRQADLHGIKDKDPSDVIQTMSARKCPALGRLQDIFCRLAKAWEADFKVLAVPHHTQVFTLLVFKAFLEDRQHEVRTLIAQVGTGEGKSMLIAALAVFVCLHTKKRVHVVGSDKKLVFRDFENFRSMFRSFQPDVAPGVPPERFAVVCSDKTDDANRADVVASIPPDAWIVYCEARHVTSFYTQQARRGELDHDSYDGRVLVLDEVDALVIDQDPTEEFVYDVGWRRLERGGTVGEYATQLGRHLARGEPCPDELKPTNDMEESVYWRLVRHFRDVELWHSKPRRDRDLEFQVYAGDARGDADQAGLTGLYVRMSNGRADPYFQSNFLECLRLRDDPDTTGYRMQWYQRLFVMCKPRVFRQYSRILGLSGTIGNEREQAFLKEAYGAQFFVVPPFLETCRGVEFHTAQWAKTEMVVRDGAMVPVSMHPGLGGPGAVAQNADEQYRIVETMAFEVRRHVPVLVIASTPEGADLVVDKLRQHARKALVGCNPSDLVRSLSQREYDRDPHMYKESLRASTRTLSRTVAGPKEFRITVTDHTGARGTDYQMFDEDADKCGGLMLIVMHVPPSQRDWVQFKGRTARQHWRGQYCVVLNAEEYRLLDGGSGGALPPEAYTAGPGRPFVPPDPELQLVQKILAFGTSESERRLDNCKAVYSAGFITNEVCEAVWERKGWHEVHRADNGRLCVDVNLEGRGRAAFLELCARYRHMSADEIAQVASSIEGPRACPGKLNFVVARDSKVPDRHYEKLPMPPGMVHCQHKAVLFMVDVSGSMTSNRIGPTLTRLDVCKTQVKNIMLNERILGDGDYWGVVAFGAGHRKIFPDARRRGGADIVGPVDRKAMQALVDNKELEAAQQGPLKEYGGELLHFEADRRVDLKNARLGMYTFLYSSLSCCADQLAQALKGSGQGAAVSRWIILLCDGDDSGGGLSEGKVKEVLRSHGPDLNLVIISVGSDVTSGPVLQSFADTVKDGGGVGLYITATDEHDDTAIRSAFAQVEESLMLDGGGQTEAGGH